MSFPEIAHRGLEQAYRFRWRFDRAGWSRFDIGSGELRDIPALHAALKAEWPESGQAAIRRAVEEVESGQLTLLGKSWPTDCLRNPKPDLWLIDPSTLEKWPGSETFCFDVDYRHSEKRQDVKFVWEINRLQFLQPVAALHLMEPSPERVSWTMQIIFSWMEANPPFRGVNWSSGIEVALRLISLAVVITCMRDQMSKEQQQRMRALVVAHTFWLHRNPSLYSSANNHRVAEGLGLVIGAQLVPDVELASTYLAQGADVLRRAPITQFYPDGIGVEQSPAYSAFTLEILALGTLALSKAHEDLRLDPTLLEEPALALKAFLDDQGRAPDIGDNDEGHIIAGPHSREPRYIASIVAAIAGLLRKPSFAPPARDFHLRDIIFRSPREGAPSHDHFSHFCNGGYSIFHGPMARRRVHLTFDHGPLGFGAISAHGHADALAFWLSVDAHPIFIDAGTYLYHGGRDLREFFRSTRSHNVLHINRQSQSLTSGPFNWQHKAQAGAIAIEHGDGWTIRARHDGYNDRFGIIHERTLKLAGTDIVLKDRLLGESGDLEVCICFVLSPDIDVEIRQEGLRLRSGETPLASIAPPHFRDSRQVKVFAEDVSISQQFGKLMNTKCIAITTRVKPQENVETRISILPPEHTSNDGVDALLMKGAIF